MTPDERQLKYLGARRPDFTRNEFADVQTLLEAPLCLRF